MWLIFHRTYFFMWLTFLCDICNYRSFIFIASARPSKDIRAINHLQQHFCLKSLRLYREWKTFERTRLLLCVFKGYYSTSCKESWSKQNSSLLLGGWIFASPNSLRHSISCWSSWHRVRHLVLLPTGIGPYTLFLRIEARFRTYPTYFLTLFLLSTWHKKLSLFFSIKSFL